MVYASQESTCSLARIMVMRGKRNECLERENTMSDGQLVSHGIDPFLEGFGCQ